MGKLIKASEKWLKYRDDPILRNKGERVNTNFEWLVEEGLLHRFLFHLQDPRLSQTEVCRIWEIETDYCPDMIGCIENWLTAPHVDKDVFDEEEIHENCTVQILRNTATGEESIGWWKNE